MQNTIVERTDLKINGAATVAGRPPGTPGADAEWNDGNEPVPTAQVALWFFLATVVMLFAGFTSAYLVRQTTGTDWTPITVPSFLWVSSAIVLGSSLMLEVARRAVSMGNRRIARITMIVTVALGLAFLVSQYMAWGELAAQGIFLPTSPHSSFFYILTGAHGLHLLGGLTALVVVTLTSSHDIVVLRRRLGLCATYWHFFALLWLLLFAVLFIL